MKALIRLAVAATFLMSVLFQSPVFAANLAESGGSWLQIVAEGNLSSLDPELKNTRLWLEGQSRWNDDWRHWYQGELRAALGYALSNRATVWAVYTWTPTQNLGNTALSQQIISPTFRYVLPTSFGTLTFRMMFQVGFGRGNDVSVIPRQLIRYSTPIGFNDRLSFVAWDEFFIRVNATDWSGETGFDQNRAFAGFGWTFTKNFRTELGYQNQYLENGNHQNLAMHHLIMGSLCFNW